MPTDGSITFYGTTIQGIATALWKSIYKACETFHRFKIEISDASEFAEISYQQIRWWKGVLLPALAKDTGDCEHVWETRLKLAVLPDEFQPEIVTVQGTSYTFIPSITTLSMKKLNTLITGSVDKLHEWGDNGEDEENRFAWVELPDAAKRKTKKESAK
ncbi:MAG: hypothetical protein WC356_03675 [Candidatus Micrarchaeia archaeon]|jgi:hypothetical protein